jgi:hypothetical protein
MHIARIKAFKIIPGMKSAQYWGHIALFSVLVSLFSIILAFGLYKYCLILLMGCIYLFVLMKFKYQHVIYLIIITIPFPIYFQFSGNDAATLTTLLILLSFFVCLADRKNKLFIGNNYVNIWLLIITLLAAASSLAVPFELAGPSARYFLVFMSCIFIFLMIVNAPIYSKNKKYEFSETLIDIVIISFFILSLIGIVIFMNPNLGNLFKIFLTRDKELYAPLMDLDVTRLNTLISGPEPTGEMLAMLSPLVLYKYFKKGKIKYLVAFIIFVIAEILTSTRSTIVLFILGSIAAGALHVPKKRVKQLLLFAIGLTATLFFILNSSESVFEGPLKRFSITSKSLIKGEGVPLIMNRKIAWDNAMKSMESINIVGHGLFPPVYYQGIKMNFHCLYLTLIYQMGWLGGGLFIILLLWIYKRLFYVKRISRTKEIRLFAYCCWISMSIFIINEIKYEFNRHAPYAQLCWILFSLFYLIGADEPNLKSKKYINL